MAHHCLDGSGTRGDRLLQPSIGRIIRRQALTGWPCILMRVDADFPVATDLRSGQRSGWGTDARAASAGIPLVLNRLDQCPHGKSTGNLHLGAVCLWRKWGRASRRENEVSCRRQDGPWLLKVNVGRARDNEKRNVHAMRLRNLPEFAYIKAGTVLIRSCRDDGDPRRDSVTLLSRDAVGL